ncbi:MAG: hypothetical protein AAFZ15_17285 [Bacteroidota bacterium]
MNNRTLGLLAVGGVLAWVGYRYLEQRKVTQSLPPPVSTGGNANDWEKWANLALNVYGSIAALWQPGGPFHKIPPSDIYHAVGPSVRQQWNWTDPGTVPSGFA